jgi:hypothetical protein
VKIKGFSEGIKSLGTDMGDRESCTVPDGDKLGGGWKEGVEITGIGCHVRGCTSVHVPIAAG